MSAGIAVIPAFSCYTEFSGSAWDPVILPVFKTGARRVRPVVGAFDPHTLPPFVLNQLDSFWPCGFDNPGAVEPVIVMKLR